MSYVAFVPARAGSKRVPGKNVRRIAGKPLLVWTIEAFASSKAIDRVILSTDSHEFWDLACRFVDPERLLLDFRSPEDAGDTVRIFDYLKRAHARIFTRGWTHFLMGLPTVPLRDVRHVESVIALAESRGRPVFSASEYEFPVTFSFDVTESGEWRPMSPGNPMVTGNTRSQDQSVFYHPNGALYLRPVMDLARPGLRSLYQDAIPYVMDRESSIDIDSELDFTIAETLLRRRLEAGG